MILVILLLIAVTLLMHHYFDMAVTRSINRTQELIKKIREEHPIVKSYLAGTLKNRKALAQIERLKKGTLGKRVKRKKK